MKTSLFLDSGTFSAWSKGIKIDIQEYINFIKKYKNQIDIYSVLDDINDPVKTLKNQKIMESAGLNPLPCYHYGEDKKYLEYYVSKYDYISLGGMVPISKKYLQLWLDNIFSCYICDSSGMPKVKIHGFGMTTFNLMRRYPWYSVDSTTWVISSRMGEIIIPRFKNNKYKYNIRPLRIKISDKGPKTNGKYYDTLSIMTRKLILKYIEMKKFDIKKLKKEYIQRDLLNLEYLKDFEKDQPKWPWPFIYNGVRGFGL